MSERWGPMKNRFGDQMATAHLLRADNSPSCGAVYHSSAGVFPGSELLPRCRNCEGHAKKRRLKEATKS